MRSPGVREGRIHDILCKYDKYLEEYDIHMAKYPELCGLQNEVTIVGGMIVAITSALVNASFLTTAPAGVEMYFKFKQWVEDEMQVPAQDMANEISFLGVGSWSDDQQLRWREVLTYSLTTMQNLYNKYGGVVAEAIGYYDKALQAIVADYQKEVQEIEESKQVKPESDEKIAAELGGYGKGAQEKKSEKVWGKEKGDSSGKTWQERVGRGSSSKEGSPNGKDSGERRGK